MSSGLRHPDALPAAEVMILGVLYRKRLTPGLSGADIARAVEERSQGIFQLLSGTVYPALTRLKKRKLLSDRWEDMESAREAGRPRLRIWSITQEGEAVLRQARKVAEVLDDFYPNEEEATETAADGALVPASR